MDITHIKGNIIRVKRKACGIIGFENGQLSVLLVNIKMVNVRRVVNVRMKKVIEKNF